MNKVFLSGVVADSPVLVQHEGGKKQLMFSLWISHRTRMGELRREQYSVNAWNSLAGWAFGRLERGQVVGLQGYLTQRAMRIENRVTMVAEVTAEQFMPLGTASGSVAEPNPKDLSASPAKGVGFPFAAGDADKGALRQRPGGVGANEKALAGSGGFARDRGGSTRTDGARAAAGAWAETMKSSQGRRPQNFARQAGGNTLDLKRDDAHGCAAADKALAMPAAAKVPSDQAGSAECAQTEKPKVNADSRTANADDRKGQGMAQAAAAAMENRFSARLRGQGFQKELGKAPEGLDLSELKQALSARGAG